MSVYIDECINPNTNGLTELEESLLDFLAKESAITYKMDCGLIYKRLSEELLAPKNNGLRSRIRNAGTLTEAQRLGEYKAFRKATRENLYQKLRQYKPSSHNINEMLTRLISCDDNDVSPLINQLLWEHISTKERMPSKNEFIENLRGNIQPGSVVIDVGCGINPLIFPVEFYHNLSCYIAVDKDTVATEAVRVFARRHNISHLKAFTWDICSGLPALKEMTGIDHYDFALLLKVIPVLSRTDQTHRNESSAIPILGELPTDRLLVTANRESMTKYERIEKRERTILRQFVNTYDFGVEAEFSCGSEFGYYLFNIHK